MADGEDQDAQQRVTIEEIIADANERIEAAEAASSRAAEALAAAEARVSELSGRVEEEHGRAAALERELQEERDKAARVPPGGNGRQATDFSQLSPVEKIRQGLAARSGGGN